MERVGGVKPRVAVRSPLRLSLEEREEVSRGILEEDSLRAITRRLHRAPSTLSREVRAAGGREKYRAWHAEERAAKRARRPKTSKLAAHRELRGEVEGRLAQGWSSQQIAARLVRDHPNKPELRVSHETIYRSLLIQAPGARRLAQGAHRLPTHRPHPTPV